ncbi:MAG: hypothetical protein ACRD0L_12800 [Acidimicrobiales bacterium]
MDPVSGRVFPFPKALALKEGSLAYFPELGPLPHPRPVPTVRHVQPEELRAGATGSGPLEAGWVVVLAYRQGAPGVLEPLTRGETAFELARHALNLPRYGARALRLLAAVTERARGYRLVFGDLEAAVKAILDLDLGDD